MTTFALPSRRHEDWRWTDLSALDRIGAAANDATPDHRRWLVEGIDGPVLLFVDGRLIHHSRHPDESHDLLRTSRGNPDVRQDDGPLAIAAKREATTGVALRLRPEHAAPGPIQLIHIATGGAAHLVHRYDLGEDAQASVIETYVGAAGSWTNVAATVTLARSARLMRTVRRVGEGGVHTETLAADISQGASYQSTLLLTGADSARSESHVTLSGEGAFASVDGVVLARAAQTFDIVNRVRHAALNGVSRQTWRSVADGKGTASVSARVEVARGAQKTDAEQSLKALLLARTATANLKPELEIFADDVKCAHGATVGELSKDALFYLASRGVAPEEASALLTEAFIADALATIGEEAMREAVTADALSWLRRGQ